MNGIWKWFVVGLVVLAVAFFVWPIPQITKTDAAPAVSEQVVPPTSDPRIDALAISQAQQGEMLAAMATQLAQPTATVIPPTAQPMETLEPLATPQVQSAQSNDWVIKWLAGADKDRGDGTTFKQDAEKWTWRKVAPKLWPTFPNVPNPLVPEFRVVNGSEVPDGLEYAMDESNFCQQLAGEDCRVPVAAQHYLFFTGDYNVPNIGSCKENGGIGCMLVIVNVGKVTSDFTGVFQQGFRLHARYWNGDALDMAMWGLVSHGSNNMLNMDSKLNSKNITNAGANCSVPGGCKGVHVQTFFVSGNEPMLNLTTTVNK